MQGPVDEARLTASGPAVHLDPQTVVLLALMLHELGTNSVKYGALSSSSGRVAVDWSVKDDLLHLQWIERGGPVVARPTKRGFGAVLIEQSVRSAGGSAEMLCETKGITWNLYLRLPRAEPQKDSHLLRRDQLKSERKEINANVVRSSTLLKGARFLVVEDEPLIALQLVGSLETAGADRVRSVGTEEEALQVIENDDFDCVLLDANLHGRSVDRIAATLTRHRMPFIFITGYGREYLPLSFRQAQTLDKPVSERQLLEAITKLLSTSGSVAQLRH
jgi:CheY-like chemotaxis protein